MTSGAEEAGKSKPPFSQQRACQSLLPRSQILIHIILHQKQDEDVEPPPVAAMFTERLGPFLCQPSPGGRWGGKGQAAQSPRANRDMVRSMGSRVQQSWFKFRLHKQVTSHPCASVSLSIKQE